MLDLVLYIWLKVECLLCPLTSCDLVIKSQTMIKQIIASLLFIVTFTFGASQVNASEGLTNLRNLQDTSARCFVSSVLMSDFNYQILLSCRDIIYPVEAEVFAYTLWAREKGTNQVFRLGEVGIGKQLFTTNKPFTSLFVTQEQTQEPQSPSGRVVMGGRVQPIPLLDNPNSLRPTPAPTPSPTAQLSAEDVLDQKDDTTSEFNAGSALRVVGIILLVVVVAIVLIALISASRRKPVDL